MHKKLAVIGGDIAATLNPLNAALSFGGDTLNTALYLSRLGFPVDYVTALGDDNLSQWMLQQWRSEGIGCELVTQEADATPGLYLIETDPRGERTFLYWRDESPARRLFDNPDNAKALFSRLMEFRAIYLTGISLGIYSPYARECLFEFLADFRAAGGTVIFDGNYRPKLWGSEILTRKAYQQMYRLTDIALPTLDDEQALFGEEKSGDYTVIHRLQELGVREIVLKKGAEGCLVVTANNRELVVANKVVPVDTTAAGDSFNAGYLAHRLSGRSAIDAAKNGHKLAALVIQHRGAIIPRTAMASVFI
jgi:2-dehydro-3-deoxygluconokinase